MNTPDNLLMVKSIIERYHQAMITARTDILDQLLDREYYMTHINGYLQPKDEWLSFIEGQVFVYHHIDVKKLNIGQVTKSGELNLNGKGIFNATIYGVQRLWDLQFELTLFLKNDSWVISRGRYTSS